MQIKDKEYRQKVRKWALSSSIIVPPADIVDLLDYVDELEKQAACRHQWVVIDKHGKHCEICGAELDRDWETNQQCLPGAL